MVRPLICGQSPATLLSLVSTAEQLPLYNPVAIALDSNANIYVANGNTNGSQFSVIVYPPFSNGSVVFPSATIIGAATGLVCPRGIAVDSSGNIYVANQGACVGATDSITVYPPGSNGNVAPSATITGPNTGLAGPWGLAIGP